MATAIVLLSGGLDSATVAAMAKRDGFTVAALTVSYGQRHAVELEAARKVAKHVGVARHEFIEVPLYQFGGSALVGDGVVPLGRTESQMMSEIPVTYVPARNTVLLSLALAMAEALGSRDIFIGANAVDYSGYPDCRPAFIEAFEALANVATKAGVEGEKFSIHAPLMELSKPEIIRRGLGLGVDYGMTVSCYQPGPTGPCFRCDSCQIRAKAFESLGIIDPALRS